MSYYYKYRFISPEPLFALIREELKSYFDTGAVDDLMFPIYLNRCLEKLGRSSHAIVPVVLFVENFKARLPDNFYAIREAWMCSYVNFDCYASGTAFYSQACSTETIQMSPVTTNEVPVCSDPACTISKCDGRCISSITQAVYKTIDNLPRGSYTRKFLLKPGNISFANNCEYDYKDDCNMYGSVDSINSSSPLSSSFDSFDIHNNQFVTTFREGIVEVLMYAHNYDNLENQMIPDNIAIREFIELYIKYKVFETLSNQTNDETFNQLQQKMINYKGMADEAYIIAETEIKKQTVFSKQRSIKKTLRRNSRYDLPGIRTGTRRRY